MTLKDPESVKNQYELLLAEHKRAKTRFSRYKGKDKNCKKFLDLVSNLENTKSKLYRFYHKFRAYMKVRKNGMGRFDLEKYTMIFESGEDATNKMDKNTIAENKDNENTIDSASEYDDADQYTQNISLQENIGFIHNKQTSQALQFDHNLFYNQHNNNALQNNNKNVHNNNKNLYNKAFDTNDVAHQMQFNAVNNVPRGNDLYTNRHKNSMAPQNPLFIDHSLPKSGSSSRNSAEDRSASNQYHNEQNNIDNLQQVKAMDSTESFHKIHKLINKEAALNLSQMYNNIFSKKNQAINMNNDTNKVNQTNKKRTRNSYAQRSSKQNYNVQEHAIDGNNFTGFKDTNGPYSNAQNNSLFSKHPKNYYIHQNAGHDYGDTVQDPTSAMLQKIKINAQNNQFFAENAHFMQAYDNFCAKEMNKPFVNTIKQSANANNDQNYTFSNENVPTRTRKRKNTSLNSITNIDNEVDNALYTHIGKQNTQRGRRKNRDLSVPENVAYFVNNETETDKSIFQPENLQQNAIYFQNFMQDKINNFQNTDYNNQNVPMPIVNRQPKKQQTNADNNHKTNPDTIFEDRNKAAYLASLNQQQYVNNYSNKKIMQQANPLQNENIKPNKKFGPGIENIIPAEFNSSKQQNLTNLRSSFDYHNISNPENNTMNPDDKKNEINHNINAMQNNNQQTNKNNMQININQRLSQPQIMQHQFEYNKYNAYNTQYNNNLHPSSASPNRQTMFDPQNSQAQYQQAPLQFQQNYMNPGLEMLHRNYNGQVRNYNYNVRNESNHTNMNHGTEDLRQKNLIYDFHRNTAQNNNESYQITQNYAQQSIQNTMYNNPHASNIPCQYYNQVGSVPNNLQEYHSMNIARQNSLSHEKLARMQRKEMPSPINTPTNKLKPTQSLDEGIEAQQNTQIETTHQCNNQIIADKQEDESVNKVKKRGHKNLSSSKTLSKSASSENKKAINKQLIMDEKISFFESPQPLLRVDSIEDLQTQNETAKGLCDSLTRYNLSEKTTKILKEMCDLLIENVCNTSCLISKGKGKEFLDEDDIKQAFIIEKYFTFVDQLFDYKPELDIEHEKKISAMQKDNKDKK